MLDVKRQFFRAEIREIWFVPVAPLKTLSSSKSDLLELQGSCDGNIRKEKMERKKMKRSNGTKGETGGGGSESRRYIVLHQSYELK